MLLQRNLLVAVMLFASVVSAALPEKPIHTVTRSFPVVGTVHCANFFYEQIPTGGVLHAEEKPLLFLTSADEEALSAFESSASHALVTKSAVAGIIQLTNHVGKTVKSLGRDLNLMLQPIYRRRADASVKFEFSNPAKAVVVEFEFTKEDEAGAKITAQVKMYGRTEKVPQAILNLLQAVVCDDSFAAKHWGKGLFAAVLGASWLKRRDFLAAFSKTERVAARFAKLVQPYAGRLKSKLFLDCSRLSLSTEIISPYTGKPVPADLLAIARKLRRLSKQTLPEIMSDPVFSSTGISVVRSEGKFTKGVIWVGDNYVIKADPDCEKRAERALKIHTLAADVYKANQRRYARQESGSGIPPIDAKVFTIDVPQKFIVPLCDGSMVVIEEKVPMDFTAPRVTLTSEECEMLVVLCKVGKVNDMHCENIMRKKDGRLVVFDLGGNSWDGSVCPEYSARMDVCYRHENARRKKRFRDRLLNLPGNHSLDLNLVDFAKKQIYLKSEDLVNKRFESFEEYLIKRYKARISLPAPKMPIDCKAVRDFEIKRTALLIQILHMLKVEGSISSEIFKKIEDYYGFNAWIPELPILKELSVCKGYEMDISKFQTCTGAQYEESLNACCYELAELFLDEEIDEELSNFGVYMPLWCRLPEDGKILEGMTLIEGL